MTDQQASAFWSRPRNRLLGVLICTLLWGSAYPAVKVGYQLFAIPSTAVSSQLLFAGLRFFLAGVLVTAFHALRQKRLVLPRKGDAKGILSLGLVQTVLQYLFFYIGMSRTSGVRGAVLNAMSSFIMVICAGILYRKTDRLTWRKAVGCILGLGGICLANLGGGFGQEPVTLTGEGFVLLSAAAMAAGGLLSKLCTQGRDTMTITGWQLMLGGAILLAVGICTGGSFGAVEPAGILLLIYMAFLSAVAVCLWTALLKDNPVSSVSVYNFLVPLFGTLFSGIFLGEEFLTLPGLAALILVCAGIYIVNWSPKEKSPQG